MRVLARVDLPEPITSVALEPGGDRVAVAVGERLLVYSLARGSLDPSSIIPLTTDRLVRPGDTGVTASDTRVAFLDERTLFVVRKLVRETPDRSVPWADRERLHLAIVDARTGELLAEHDEPFEYGLRTDPLPVSERHVLIERHYGQTIACLEVPAFREVCRVRSHDDEGNVIGEDDCDPEEQVAPDGFVYDDRDQLLHVLWGVFNEAILQTYRLDLADSRFLRVSRSSVLERHEPVGLCLIPSGEGVAATFQVMDDLIDLRGERIADWTQSRDDMLARRGEGEPELPRTARLGCLGLFSGQDRRFLDIISETERDFMHSPQWTPDEDGRMVVVGFRLGARTGDGAHLTKPVFVDDGRVVVGTPSGFLLCVDVENRRSEVIHDFGSPIRGIRFHRDQRLLLVGCADGTFVVGSLGG
jgi:hypothetical protein